MVAGSVVRFSTACEAFELAKRADGSVFECRARLINATEI
jgi:hypothetical protein